ncbi:MAG: wax ester/triacylglycerol synthase domain-containing protein [Pseudonocardiaceae bacterium]
MAGHRHFGASSRPIAGTGSPLVTSSSGQRALATARLDLRQIRRIRAHFGGTVNDVLLSVEVYPLAPLAAGQALVVGLSQRICRPVRRPGGSAGRAAARRGDPACGGCSGGLGCVTALHRGELPSVIAPG